MNGVDKQGAKNVGRYYFSPISLFNEGSDACSGACRRYFSFARLLMFLNYCLKHPVFDQLHVIFSVKTPLKGLTIPI
jgi:hypothetical protein